MRIRELVKALFGLTRARPWVAPVIVGLGLLGAAFEGVGLYLFIPLIGSLSGGGLAQGLPDVFASFAAAVPPEQRTLIFVGAVCAAIAAKNLVGFVNYMVARSADGRIAHDLRVRIFEQTLRSGVDYAGGVDKTDIVNTLATESWRVTYALNVLLRVCICAGTFIVFLGLMIAISWRLTLLALIAMAVTAGIIQLLTLRAEALGRETVEANKRFGLRMWEAIDGLKLIRSFTREDYERGRFSDRSDEIRRRIFRLDMLWAVPGPVSEMAVTLLIGGLILTAQGTGAGFASLAAFLALLYKLQGPARELVSAKVAIDGVSASVADVFDYLKRTETPVVKDGARRCERFEREISFDRVSFAYETGDRPALRDLAFSIPRGKTTAIVGRSGAGKSTLLDLLFRFRDPSDGAILVDGAPLSGLELRSWRERLSVMSQEVWLFNETVRENIAYGKPGATEAEIEAAAKIADAHDFILKLPQGYDTKLGDRGVRLSGGQRQRIALARTVLRDPDVLLLDEATNALDSFAERKFQAALERWAEGRTVVVVAHRLSTIERADQVIVLDDGRVVEQGPPDELRALGGQFAAMRDIQIGTPIPAAAPIPVAAGVH